MLSTDDLLCDVFNAEYKEFDTERFAEEHEHFLAMVDQHVLQSIDYIEAGYIEIGTALSLKSALEKHYGV